MKFSHRILQKVKTWTTFTWWGITSISWYTVGYERMRMVMSNDVQKHRWEGDLAKVEHNLNNWEEGRLRMKGKRICLPGNRIIFFLQNSWITKTIQPFHIHEFWIYTSFLASKKLFKCLICQNPMQTKTTVWATDHHNTREFVLSLVWRKRSSR